MSLSGRVERLEELAGITPGCKALEDMSDQELLNIAWPDGRWRAWTAARLDEELRLVVDRTLRDKTDEELRAIAQGEA